ncbi:MAG: NAD(P)H-dependent oxidoreductase [Pseudomonadota bacterium]
MRRVLVLHAHPVPTSFNAALFHATCEGLRAGGWEVDGCDLYAECFNPVMSEVERVGYHTTPDNIAPVAGYVDRVREATALVLVFPVWNFGYPAMLKGFFDRVFLPGVSFELVDGTLQANLTHVHRLAAVTTYGATRVRAFAAGDPPRKVVTRALKACLHPGASCTYHALYDMNTASDGRRTGYLARVRTAMEQF